MMRERKTSLLIADDHPIFRAGLKQVIRNMPWLEIVAEAESGESALAQIRYLKPEIALLDLAMPGLDGLSVLEQVRRDFPDLIVVIVTSYDDQAYLDRALKLGANGYVIKDSASEHLENCLRSVMSGQLYISPSMGRQQVKTPSAGSMDHEALQRLTPMERTVLAEVAEFLTSKEIARKLDISYRTVQNHRSNISEKLGLKGSHQLVRFAQQHLDIIRPD